MDNTEITVANAGKHIFLGGRIYYFKHLILESKNERT